MCDLIFDTNCIIDSSTFYDIEREGVAGNQAEVEYRANRLGAGVLFIWGAGATGQLLGVAREFERIIERMQARAPDDVNSEVFGMVYGHFILDHLLPETFTLLEEIPQELAGEAVDDALLQCAQDRGVPLVTNEGWRRDGIRDGELRTKAQNAGVPVYTTQEWVLQACTLGGNELVTTFEQAFLDAMPRFLDAREHQGDQMEGSMHNMLEVMITAMRHSLASPVLE